MNDSIVIAAYAKNKKILFNSSSGGVFYAIAKYVINDLQGAVYGCTIEGTNVFHKRVDELEELPSLMKSKYVQSDLRNVFEECATDLVKGKTVLFVGSPCQIFAIKNFLTIKKIDQSKFVSADFVCHGTPAKKYWNSYCNEAFRGSRFRIDFRYNRPSWSKYSVNFSCDGKTVIQSITENEYMRAFLGNYTLMEACYNCRYKKGKSGADFTFGDFWGGNTYYPELCSPRGTSIVVARGKKTLLFKALGKDYVYGCVDLDAAFKFNRAYFDSAERPKDKNAFDVCFKRLGLIEASRQFAILPSPKKISGLKKAAKAIKPLFQKRVVKKFEKRTIGIITDQGFYNFGNRLQNYALRKKIDDFGFKSVNLSLHRHSSYHFLFGVSKLHEKLILKRNKKNYKKRKNIRKASLKSGDKTLYFAYDSFGKKQIKELSGVLIGSDQIWNWTYHKSDLLFSLGFFGCTFDKPIFSYAASMGVDYIEDNLKETFRNELLKYANVGVRENVAADLLNEIGIPSTVNLDPTLLLTKDEWEHAVNQYSSLKISPNKYLLKYILGENGTELDMDWEGDVVNLSDENNKFYTVNQFDFIKLIKNSSLIITDSFHAFVFAIIYGKKIVLVPRDEMKSRFESICSIAGIKYVKNAVIDTSKVDFSKITMSQKESLAFLAKSLRLVEEAL